MTSTNIIHSRTLVPDTAGELLTFSRDDAGWEWMDFSVRRLAPGELWKQQLADQESVYVLLGGHSTAIFDGKRENIGNRKNVFDGLPFAFYRAPGDAVEFKASTWCEFAVCHVPSGKRLESRLITPNDVQVSIRGGGNASRQIVDIVRPEFPADRLIVVEVYTPGGNWSSYPPHKHEIHNPPAEVDLDEIYYYRMARPGAFAHQRLYSSDGKRDTVLTVHDGDAVLVHDGYHPVVAGPGYDVYYLNFIAGTARSLAVTEDAVHTWIRSAWTQVDERLPLVRAQRIER